MTTVQEQDSKISEILIHDSNFQDSIRNNTNPLCSSKSVSFFKI